MAQGRRSPLESHPAAEVAGQVGRGRVIPQSPSSFRWPSKALTHRTTTMKPLPILVAYSDPVRQMTTKIPCKASGGARPPMDRHTWLSIKRSSIRILPNAPRRRVIAASRLPTGLRGRGPRRRPCLARRTLALRRRPELCLRRFRGPRQAAPRCAPGRDRRRVSSPST